MHVWHVSSFFNITISLLQLYLDKSYQIRTFINDNNYLSWVLIVETHFDVMNLRGTIKGKKNTTSSQEKAKAIIFFFFLHLSSRGTKD